METLYGRNPKHIMCQCNAVETNDGVITISLNDRCPICDQVRHICIPKREIKVKDVPHIGSYGMKVA